MADFELARRHHEHTINATPMITVINDAKSIKVQLLVDV